MRMRPDAAELMIRAPLPEDEAQALAAQEELAAEGFDFLLGAPERSWEQYLQKVEKDRLGIDLGAGRVPATMLFAVVGDDIVGRVHIRHDLTPGLLRVGGHIGYGVRPGHRCRGYATAMLRHALAVLEDLGVDRALVTCDDDNLGSIRTIEQCGGVLENTVTVEQGVAKRRYWIELATECERIAG